MCRSPTHTAEEERHFTELALRLIDLVDARTRAIVAEKIAGYAERTGGGAAAAAARSIMRSLPRQPHSPG